ncbi:hypothetical protein JTE90_018275 [Oedothorax gibbosus]|uniref:GDT1 family protein n=1 Tax=Oedothorax gibbosus TaxID=931172 RepID=A0AAV6UZF4_9ARAC|nr:hypothetical protein JTE90_018275 [Oedothorax gibbosus]
MSAYKIFHFVSFLLVFVYLINSTLCEEAPTSVVNKNVEFPGNYEDVGGDFKRPASFLQRFGGQSGQLGFIHAFLAAVSVILVSELGDKTFFIAAIMAMRHPRITVFLGAMSALTVMTILSACLGFATTVIPRAYTHYISTALFAIFGLKMLKEAYDMSPDEGQEEYEEVQKNLSKRETEYDGQSDVETGPIVTGGNSRWKALRRKLMVFFSRVFLESFTMTFLAEWGDRSQLTTIILAAREDAVGVTLGAVIGHGMCSALAVIGGRIVAQRISVRTVTFIGGIVFLIFSVWALAMGPGT